MNAPPLRARDARARSSAGGPSVSAAAGAAEMCEHVNLLARREQLEVEGHGVRARNLET
jgi:hypothetical protein